MKMCGFKFCTQWCQPHPSTMTNLSRKKCNFELWPPQKTLSYYEILKKTNCFQTNLTQRIRPLNRQIASYDPPQETDSITFSTTELGKCSEKMLESRLDHRLWGVVLYNHGTMAWLLNGWRTCHRYTRGSDLRFALDRRLRNAGGSVTRGSAGNVHDHRIPFTENN